MVSITMVGIPHSGGTRGGTRETPLSDGNDQVMDNAMAVSGRGRGVITSITPHDVPGIIHL